MFSFANFLFKWKEALGSTGSSSWMKLSESAPRWAQLCCRKLTTEILRSPFELLAPAYCSMVQCPVSSLVSLNSSQFVPERAFHCIKQPNLSSLTPVNTSPAQHCGVQVTRGHRAGGWTRSRVWVFTYLCPEAALSWVLGKASVSVCVITMLLRIHINVLIVFLADLKRNDYSPGRINPTFGLENKVDEGPPAMERDGNPLEDLTRL